MQFSFAEKINILFFLMISLTSMIFRNSARRRIFILTIGAFGIFFCLLLAASFIFVSHEMSSNLRYWAPVGLMLVAYHQSGLLFDKPLPKFQNWLIALDRRLLGGIHQGSGVIPLPTFWNIYLETCYLLCYPLIPAALGVLILLGCQDRIEEFWTIVLLSAYICYAFVPILPALPPRSLPTDSERKRSSGTMRALNELILRYGSIKANTFPSAHVASCTAGSIVLLRYDILYGSIFLWFSVSIATAVVVRRYHYAVDAILGLMLPIFLFFLMKW